MLVWRYYRPDFFFPYYHKIKLQIHDTYHFKKGIKISDGCVVRVLGHVCKKKKGKTLGAEETRNYTSQIHKNSCILAICKKNKNCCFCSNSLTYWINTSHLCLNILQNFNKKHMTHIFTEANLQKLNRPNEAACYLNRQRLKSTSNLKLE